MGFRRSLCVTVLTVAALPAVATGQDQSRILQGVPTHMQISGIDQVQGSEDLNRYSICIDIYNRVANGGTGGNPDWPGKVIKHVNASRAVGSGYNSVTIESDWSPISDLQIEWFDRSFRYFPDGRAKPITRWTSELEVPFRQGYRYCEIIPFAKTVDISYLRRKLRFQLQPAMVSWQADFSLVFELEGVKYPYDYQSGTIRLPMLGSSWQDAANNPFLDIVAIYKALNLKELLGKVSDYGLALEASRILNLPSFESEVAAVQKQCRSEGSNRPSHANLRRIVKRCHHRQGHNL